MKHAGFQFNINCNQIGAHRARVQDGIDLIDLAIMDIIIQYSTWEGCKKQTHNGKNYFHFSWRVLPQRAPMIGLNSRSPIKTRIQKLCGVGLLIPHPENQTTGESWFCFGPKYALFQNFTPVLEKSAPSLTEDTPPSLTEDTPVLPEGHNEYTYSESNNSERGPHASELPKQKEEKPVIADLIDKIRADHPGKSDGELRVIVLTDQVKAHFRKYPADARSVTENIGAEITIRELREEVEKWVRYWCGKDAAFASDPIPFISRTLKSWLVRWASGKREELRRSGAASGVYEKPKV